MQKVNSKIKFIELLNAMTEKVFNTSNIFLFKYLNEKIKLLSYPMDRLLTKLNCNKSKEKVALILITICINFSALSQDRTPPLMIGMNEQKVRQILDSLNNLSSNPYYKVKQSANDDGDLVLTTEYSDNEEYLYKCSSLSTIFKRILGENICTMQSLFGTDRYAEDNLKYVKDFYRYISPAKWMGEYLPLRKLSIQATFTKTKGEDPFFLIKYQVVKDSTFSHTFYPNKSDWLEFGKDRILKYPINVGKLPTGETVCRTILKIDYTAPFSEEKRTMEMTVDIVCSINAILFRDTKVYDSKGKLIDILPNTNMEWQKAQEDFYGETVPRACEFYSH